MNSILIRRWTWQWMALLGLLAIVFHVTLHGWIWIDEVLLRDDPIPVFYDYPYSDVALAKKGGDNALYLNISEYERQTKLLERVVLITMERFLHSRNC